MNLFESKNNLKLGLFIFSFLLVFFLDKALAVGMFLIILLSLITLFFIDKNKEHAKILSSIFLIALLIHLAVVLFVYYAHFQPFSGGRGDYTTYNSIAEEIYNRVESGNFSLEGLSFSHYYPIIVGYLYVFTLPSMLIGQLFNAWIATLAILFVYLIVRKIGGTEKQGFFAAMIAVLYPSFLFYGTMLVKDPWVVLLCLAGLFFAIKLIERFSWKNFLIFYIILGYAIHFRIYVGMALLVTFVLCWLLFSNLGIKKRLIYGIIIISFLGFLPQIATEQGYYGINFLKSYLNSETITYYREVVYLPSPSVSTPISAPAPTPAPASEKPSTPGQQSSVVVEAGFENPLKFIKNTLISFSYSLLGPFPWQMKHLRHFLALGETIAWYFLLFFAIKGAVKSAKNYKMILPLIIFSLGILFILALFINNFGIITRIRIPAFISLLCLVPFGINWMANDKTEL